MQLQWHDVVALHLQSSSVLVYNWYLEKNLPMLICPSLPEEDLGRELSE